MPKQIARALAAVLLALAASTGLAQQTAKLKIDYNPTYCGGLHHSGRRHTAKVAKLNN